MPGAVGPKAPRLLDRVPDDLRGQVLRLSARDHLVEVSTCQGVVEIRLRLADAIREMEPVEGFLIHRSHWVMRDAIDRVERTSGKVFLVLVNGDRVPVSRTYRAGLEAAGIL